MANPRRVAWLLAAAQVGVAAFIVGQPASAQQRATPPAAEEDEEDEEEEPSTASATPAATPAPAAGAQSGERPRHHADFPPAGETEEDREARRDRMINRFSSLSGAIGLVRLQTAEGGSEQTFRFSLIAGYFGPRRFPRP